VKLAYHDVAAGEGRCDVVVLHRDVGTPTEPLDLIRATGRARRLVAPWGDYAVYPSGMEIGGVTWYRLLRASTGTDAISLAKAVVQVADLLDDLAEACPRPALVGWGQGGVVAAGVGLSFPDKVGSVACVDGPSADVAALPPSGEGALPPFLVAAADAGATGDVEPIERLLGARGASVATWSFDGDGAAGDALVGRLGTWLDDPTG